MGNKIEIVYDIDRSEVLHDAIVGHSIVKVLAGGVPVAEANNTYGVRDVTLVMDTWQRPSPLPMRMRLSSIHYTKAWRAHGAIAPIATSTTFTLMTGHRYA